MSDEERKRNEVMVRVKKGDLGLRNAAEILGISYRQVRRHRPAAPPRSHPWRRSYQQIHVKSAKEA